MKKINSLSKIKKFGMLCILASGIVVFLSFTKHQRAESKSNLEMMSDGDDDEALSSSCGGAERWSEKVFTDADAGSIDFAHPHTSSVTHIIGLPTVTPTTYQAKIMPQEDSVYTVIVHILEYRPESDSDSHLVINDGTSTMIAEIPDPGCSSVAASPKVADFIVCKDWVYKNLGYVINTSVSLPLVQITGVAYYDPPHGQSGAAPNNLELHSVIDIHFYVPTGIDNVIANGGVNVYPIPNNGQFTVGITEQKANISVYNLLGQEVYTGELAAGLNQVDMSVRSSGMYIYRVLSENGDLISEGKMIVNK